ncbi:MAG: carboxypeptidase-like regulatory domain-containing protein, partial [Candidatus Korobacteraceae bacterium]
MPSYRRFTLAILRTLLSVCLLFLTGLCFAADGASISGTVADPSGAVIPGAAVVLRNLASGAQQTAAAKDDGSYAFNSVPAGHYEMQIEVPEFKPYRDPNIEVAANAALHLDAVLALAPQTEAVEVSSNPSQVDLASTQSGDLITAKKMTSVPLNGRSFTDLLATQPGVVPASSAQPNAVVMSGCTTTPPSGDLNAGNLSVSGQRETANGFTVNGSIVEEDFNNGTAVVPNLDAIQDFRMLTNNFDAEYGNYSGGQVIVSTKSGSNQIHGNVFEFLRNTDLEARNYFATSRAAYDRNQYGGTLGGPIRKDKAYFFVDYQGTQMTQGQETGIITVPSLADRSGNLSDLASQLTGKVSSTYWASQLSQKLGYQVSAGEPYYSAGCTSSTQCVFPNAKIPTSIWSAPAKALLQYIPQPNIGSNLFSDSAENETLGDSKAAARFDVNTLRFGNISAYYLLDQYAMNNPYPTPQGGANVPGFNALSNGRAQLFSVSAVKALGT